MEFAHTSTYLVTERFISSRNLVLKKPLQLLPPHTHTHISQTPRPYGTPKSLQNTRILHQSSHQILHTNWIPPPTKITHRPPKELHHLAHQISLSFVQPTPTATNRHMLHMHKHYPQLHPNNQTQQGKYRKHTNTPFPLLNMHILMPLHHKAMPCLARLELDITTIINTSFKKTMLYTTQHSSLQLKSLKSWPLYHRPMDNSKYPP